MKLFTVANSNFEIILLNPRRRSTTGSLKTYPFYHFGSCIVRKSLRKVQNQILLVATFLYRRASKAFILRR